MALLGDARSTFLAVVKGDASQAVTEFRRMGGAIQKETGAATGSVGRFSQMMGKAKTEIGANSGLIAAGVGIAAVAVAAKFAFMAQELGLAVGHFADASGLTTEAASRWIEVAGDIGVSVDEVSGLIVKMTQNLGKSPDKFRELGIEVQHARDGTVDMNATLLGAIDVLSAIKDPTTRAALGAQLFGKSWATAAELITHGADDIKKKLGDVDSSKVMSADDVKKAREMREAIDHLKDIFEEFALSVGKSLVPVLTALVKVLSDLEPVLKLVGKGAGLVGTAVDKTSDGISWFAHEMTTSSDGTKIWNEGLNKSISTLAFVGQATVTFGDATKEAAQHTYQMGQDAESAAQHTKNLAMEADQAKTAIQQLQDQLTNQSGWTDLQLNLLGVGDKLAAAKKAFEDGGLTAEEYALTVQGITQHAQDDIAGYLTHLEGIPAEIISQITSQFDPNNVDASLKAMQLLVDKYNLHVPITGGGSGALGSTARNFMEGRASGGPASGLLMVGERGPELVNLPGGSFVHNAPETARMMGNSSSAGPEYAPPQPIILKVVIGDKEVQQITVMQNRAGKGSK